MVYEMAPAEVTKGSPLCCFRGAAVPTAWHALEDDLSSRIHHKPFALGGPVKAD
ncbi:hypothetical protein PC116_g9865 [Phytophthora cactorum]|nr:hypothetical protein Pcac1_g16019 [Phytophthora cactorum]KAG2897508.1 hypothetical protein PC114_g14648 [Phytophthora cactorum]KAG3010307.1 hypothetical protein PC120_g15133 [Phytophthora cactorum]KAG3020046.1 hypothetical protein PC119_g10109 [Phytophthora cactorum]KAG3150124.1 hypothetical protein C6341_g16845 [Phytophthora cactorum]